MSFSVVSSALRARVSRLVIAVWLVASGTAVESLIGQTVDTLVVVRALDEVEVPAKRDGLIEQLLLRRGSGVDEDQLVATLDVTDKMLQKRVAEAKLEQALTKSQNEGLIKSSKAAVNRARVESQLMRELGKDAVYLEKFRMENNLEKALAELQSTENQWDQDRLQVEIEQHELSVLENDIQQTRVMSPVTGVVREVKRDQGEWVRQGDAILVVTRLDRLLAEGFLDSSTLPVHSVLGATATVTFRVSQQETTTISGLVIDRSAPNLELDGKYPIWIEFENVRVSTPVDEETWLIRPGMRGTLSIEIPSSQVTSSVGRTKRTLPAGESSASLSR